MPCTATPRGKTDNLVQWLDWIDNDPCGKPTYAGNLCQFHWELANGQFVAVSSYQAAVLSDGPRGYWRLEEASGTFVDSSGLGHTMTPAGGVTYGVPGAGHGGSGITLNGTTGYLQTPDHNDFDLGDVFTLECWAKIAAYGAAPYQLITKGTNGYALYIEIAGAAWLAKANVATLCYSTINVPTDSAWHHFVGTKNGAAINLYIDGVDRTGGVTNFTCVDNATVLAVGGNAGGTQLLNGSIDEVAVYPTALSAARVLAHYQAGIA